MPYFVFHLKRDSRDQITDMNLLDQFEEYKEAKKMARDKRVELDVSQPGDIKIMFADSRDQAENKLSEHREAPILREWEK